MGPVEKAALLLHAADIAEEREAPCAWLLQKHDKNHTRPILLGGHGRHARSPEVQTFDICSFQIENISDLDRL